MHFAIFSWSLQLGRPPTKQSSTAPSGLGRLGKAAWAGDHANRLPTLVFAVFAEVWVDFVTALHQGNRSVGTGARTGAAEITGTDRNRSTHLHRADQSAGTGSGETCPQHLSLQGYCAAIDATEIRCSAPLGPQFKSDRPPGGCGCGNRSAA